MTAAHFIAVASLAALLVSGVAAFLSLRAMRAALARQAELQRAIAVTGAATWSIDIRTGVLRAAPRLAEIMGLDPERTVITRELLDRLCHPDDRQRLRGTLATAMVPGTTYSIDYRTRHALGHYIWLQCLGGLVHDDSGKAVRIAGTALDVTQRRKADDELVHGRESLQLAMEASQAGYFDLDTVAGTAYWSPRALEILGRDQSAPPTAATLPTLIHPDDLVEFLAEREDFRIHNRPLDIELRIRHAAGHYVWIHLRATSPSSGSGEPARVIGLIRDISQRRRTEEAVVNSEKKLRDLVDGSIQGILILDRLTPLFCNRACANLFGYDTPEEFIANGSIARHLTAETTTGFDEIWTALMRGEHDGAVRRRQLLSLQGRIVDAEVVGRRIQWDGRAAWQVTMFDVTERVAREAELNTAHSRLEVQAQDLAELARSLENERQRAEHASAAKSQFLAMMSHELRTPMTGVLGMADLLRLTDLNEEQRDLTQLLTRSARMLLDLLNDILDFSKIEAGQLQIERTPFKVSGIVADVLKLFESTAAEKGIELESELPAAYADGVVGDPKRLRQVLVNLVNNAIKFTEKGVVKIAMQQQVEGDDITLRFAVVDTGIGIGDDDRPRLFEPFIQADVSTSRKFGGTGLGLAICKRLVEAMDGRIGVESEAGAGSRFNFSVRVRRGELHSQEARSEEQVSAERAMPRFAPRRILLAEDNDTSRYLITTMLKRHGHDVDAVENGALALEAVTKKAYDIVLMDMQMPVMDGPEATCEIRKLAAPVGTIPIIALTADLVADHRRSYLRSGVNVVVGKPVNWLELEQEMDRQLRSAGQRTEAPKATHLRAASPVVAGDDADIVDDAALTALANDLGNEILATMLDSFTVNMLQYREDLRTAATSGDLKRAKRVAHALKGLCAQFGAPRASSLAKFIEDQAKEMADVLPLLSDVDAAIAATETAFAARRQALSSHVS